MIKEKKMSDWRKEKGKMKRTKYENKEKDMGEDKEGK